MLLREKNVEALEHQVVKLFSLVDETVKINGGGYYTNKLYKEAEAELKRIEEEEKLKAEAEKKEEIDRIKAECKKDMQQQIDKLEKEYEAKISDMREQIRKDIAEKENGFFTKIGKALDNYIIDPIKRWFN